MGVNIYPRSDQGQGISCLGLLLIMFFPAYLYSIIDMNNHHIKLKDTGKIITKEDLIKFMWVKILITQAWNRKQQQDLQKKNPNNKYIKI